jgi:hypothetical protein
LVGIWFLCCLVVLLLLVLLLVLQLVLLLLLLLVLLLVATCAAPQQSKWAVVFCSAPSCRLQVPHAAPLATPLSMYGGTPP